MDGDTVITVDHEEIKKWILDHNGKPALVGKEGQPEDETGIRVDFPGTFDERFLRKDEPNPDISWEEFFKIFEDKNLAFMYYSSDENIQDPTLSFRFVPREVKETPEDFDQTEMESY